MKAIHKYIAAAGLLCSMALSSCDDDFARPPIVAPESPLAGMENTTIAQFKNMYWQDANNYAASIGKTVEGKDIIIKARVISSDATSCLYQYLYVQDETGAMTIAARQLNSSTKLATQYGYGQEVYINATGLYAGRYAGLFQIGSSTDGSSTTFIDNSVLLEHVSANGLGQPDKIDRYTVTIPEMTAALSSTEEIMKYQAHAVRIENVHFTSPGQAFIPVSGQDASITFADADGNTMIIRLNRYCTFGNTKVPGGTGTISGELGFFNNVWQMTINNIDDLEGFDFDNTDTPDTPDEPTGEPEGEGTAASPYNSLKAYEVTKALAADATTESEYYVKGKVSAIKELSTSFGNATYSITSEGTSQAFDIFRGYYFNGDKFTAEDQLKVGDEVVVCGKLVNFKGNTPQMAQGSRIISINGQGGSETPDTPGDITAEGDGSEANPYNTLGLRALNPTNTQEAVATGVWLKGYIVGFMPTGGTSTTLAGTTFGTAEAATTNIVVGPTPDCKDVNLCVGIQLPSGAVRNALNLSTNPGNLGKAVTLKGDVMKYCGGPGLKNTSAYTLDGQGGDTPDTPVEGQLFSSLSDKDAALSTGWTIENVTTGGLENVWSWKVYNNAGYLNGSGFANGAATATEAYAISPVIDLTGATGIAMSFEHAAKFQTTLRTLCGVVVREEGAKAWTALTIPTWPEAGAWTFAASGSISLEAYAGKKIQIAFKYASSADGADTWEIKNLVITGKK